LVTPEAESTAPAPLTHREILIVFSGLMLGMLLAALDQTIVATALPTMVGELGGLTHLSWVITAYLLTSTASTPLYGKLSDLYGRKVLYQSAIVIFLVGSALSGLSQSMTQLIAFRAVQGLGAGGLMALAMTIIADIVSPRERGRYQGYMGSVFAFSSVAGPLLGGLFVDELSWRWVFYINIPLGILALFVTGVVLHVPFERRPHSIDFLGAALLVLSISCLLLMTTWGGNEYPWRSAEIISLGVVGTLAAILFLLQERRAAEPILPLRLFRESVFAVSSSIGFILGLALFGALAFMPVYFQVVNGASATSSGLRLVPMMAGIIVTSVLAGRRISATGRYRRYPIAGTAIMTVGIVLLTQLDTQTPMLEASAFLLIMGIGVGMVMPVTVLAVQNAVDRRDLGAATAGSNLFRSLGSAFGVAIFGSILSNRLSAELPKHLPTDALQRYDFQALTSSPERLRALPPEVYAGVVESFATALQWVYLWAVPFGLLAFVLTWFLRELPLRDTVHARSASTTEALTESVPHPPVAGQAPEPVAAADGRRRTLGSAE
jgi:EmrB/QacA subfamily drug resistance transporter